MLQHNLPSLRTRRIMHAWLQQCMLPMCNHGINTSTLHVDGWTFHDSLEALTQCSAQDGRSSPRSMLARSCQFWVCWRAGPRTRLRRTCQQARQTNFTSVHARKFLFPRKPSALAAVHVIKPGSLHLLMPRNIRSCVEFLCLPRSSSHRSNIVSFFLVVFFLTCFRRRC